MEFIAIMELQEKINDLTDRVNKLEAWKDNIEASKEVEK
jgi:phage shock protein A